MKLSLVLVFVTLLSSLLLSLELAGRLIFGLGNPLLYIPHPRIGYLLSPNQKVKRFGNQISINQYSMRSQPISPIPPANTKRILLLGDSVANGSWWTDQNQILSALIERLLVERLQTTPNPQPVEVLNASANSWGPRNQLAYLQEFGIFGAEAVVLLINTDDLFATAPTSEPVGHDLNYPDRKPPLALVELFTRYLLPKPAPSKALQAIQAETGDRVGRNLASLHQINEIVKSQNKVFLVGMTPLLRETGDLGPQEYEKIARRRLEELTKAENIPYIDFLPIFNAIEQPKNLYRDHIHLSSKGNEKVAQPIADALAQ
ncbi:SGNH/GDSL hydrolase family protein [Ancylothrix sp. C2]|uniref:SGNH/GDSL hydrolase family protein n=1 Tax=Ancylothrix sp. D3o TaxID=2953691 RepID=UPI0021BB4979|nr:SGNH/GDSL hydrolase family protein [Ancylothrix sp. D3o]MCT7948214.1 SGNH/GDSL hydrolase family protein [Ancylothrix sp. D3o]